MKRKLVYDESEEPCPENESQDALSEEKEIDYEPVHFLRCHSRKNDPADVRTQVWHCAFEPDAVDPKKTTNFIATCGGNSVCLINVRTGEVTGKFNSKDQKEMFYSVAWTTLLVESGDPPQINVLAAAGARNTLHLIHPEGGVAFHEHQFLRSKRVNVSSLMFHPKQGNILFCAMGDGQVLTWNVGSPAPPNYETQLNLLLTLEARSEIFSLVFSSHLDILLAASNTGVCGWVVTQDMLRKKPNNVAMLKFNFPKRRGNTTRTSEPQLVDSIEMVGQSTVATKCALHGVIYLWNLTSAIQGDAVTTVQPTHVLQWSDTDNYFMNMGCHPVAGLLACGDDMGALWLYDLSNILQQPAQDKRVAPSTILDWPDVEDSHVDRNRKLRLGVYDIVVDKVAVSSNGRYLVAVTSNNMVCIWKRTK